MSNFSSNVQKAYKKRWSFINNFTCSITPISTELQSVASEFGILFRDLDLNIKDVTVPQYSYNMIEFWMVDRYRATVGQTAPMTVTITFRDEDQMRLYKAFLGMLQASKNLYPDNAAISIKVSKDADYLGELDNVVVFDAQKALITSVSQLNFSNETEAQIAEFSVEFYVFEYTIHG